VIGPWARENPRAAGEWLASRGAAGIDARLPRALGAGLSRHPFEVVVTGLAAISDATARHHAGDAILDTWLEQSLAGAADLAGYLLQVSGEASLLDRVAARWVERDAAQALRGPKASKTGTVRAAALIHLTSALARRESGQISALVARLSLSENTSFFSALASRWAERDPAATIDWTLNLPAGAGKDCVMQSLAAAVGRIDPARMRALIETFPPHLREAAAPALASAWAARNPHAAVLWAQTLPDGEVGRHCELPSRCGLARHPRRRSSGRCDGRQIQARTRRFWTSQRGFAKSLQIWR